MNILYGPNQWELIWRQRNVIVQRLRVRVAAPSLDVHKVLLSHTATLQLCYKPETSYRVCISHDGIDCVAADKL